MKKVFIIHGFQGSPNGGWRPWLMVELDKLDIYACALPMPTPDEPKCEEWVAEIAGVIPEVNEDIFLVGPMVGMGLIRFRNCYINLKKLQKYKYKEYEY
jgi:hypothetical protein